MKTETVFEDKRLLEALDHIDCDLIAEAMDTLKIPGTVKQSVPGKRTPFRYWKQFTALAACLFLLMFVFPVFNKVAEVISSFAAGWGSGMTEEISESSDTEEVPYLQFSPDLEPISQELIDEINEFFIPFYLRMTKDELVAKYGEDYATGRCADLRVIQGPDDCYTPYLGTIGDYVIFVFGTFGNLGPLMDEIGGYRFEQHTYVYCTETQTMYTLKQAYEIGLLKDRHLKLVSERRAEFFDYVYAHKELLW